MKPKGPYRRGLLVLQLLLIHQLASPVRSEYVEMTSARRVFADDASADLRRPEVARKAADASSLHKPTAAQNALAGAIAGFVARIAVAPIDLIKIRLQIQTNPISQASKFKYKGLFGTMKTIVKEEGVFALWKGNIPAQIMFSAYNAARDVIQASDTVIRTLQRACRRDDCDVCQAQWTNTHEGQLSMNFVAGGIAGASATIGDQTKGRRARD
eukprot:767660-Hanusia_phi.AAC.6